MSKHVLRSMLGLRILAWIHYVGGVAFAILFGWLSTSPVVSDLSTHEQQEAVALLRMFPHSTLIGVGIGLGALIVVVGYGLEYTRRHLARNKYWAWITGVITAVMILPSILFPLAIFMLIELFHKETRAWVDTTVVGQ